ncbi:uncharacterized protein LOC122068157 [Macadamia integrifolia]|uniref:uncharacterized protein LOC122068157 n=1 Tax=Macadamia integrifolia TaxID=60698 RepID=UPI001C4FE8DE|nr:uncharacterized protein LOC122068157 [Macadamia integrifolia]
MTKEGVSGDKMEASGDSASLFKDTQLVGWWKKLMELLWFCVSNVFLIYIQEMFTKLVRDQIEGRSEVSSRGGGVSPPLASGSGNTLKFQTVKNGVQENLNEGRVKIGNIGPAIPSHLASIHASMEFQTAEEGIQHNGNSGDVELWNWG